jgi:D-erythrulose 4-kinase
MKSSLSCTVMWPDSPSCRGQGRIARGWRTGDVPGHGWLLLTMFWLDDEQEELWASPADAPGYRKLSTVIKVVAAASQPRDLATDSEAAMAMGEEAPISDNATADPEAAALARRRFEYMLLEVERVEDDLGRIDAVAGDGDHGRGMTRGLRAAVAAAAGAGDVPSDVVIAAGSAWAEAAGGASGALWGGMLRSAGRVLAERGTGTDAIAQALREAVSALTTLGGARRGDKTMLDALGPFVDAFIDRVRSGEEMTSAWTASVPASEDGAHHTATLVSRRGRSSVLGERSLGTPDPGAISVSYCLGAVGRALSEA